MAGADLTDMWDFIKATVNGVDGSVWRVNDKVTICDGTSCEFLIFQVGCSCWMPLGNTFPDSGHGYRNGQDDRAPAGGSSENNSGGIWGWIHHIGVTVINWISGAPKAVTGDVIINQSAAATSHGFQADFGSHFDFNADNTSLDWGGDFEFGGGDMFGGGGGTIGGCDTTFGSLCNNK